MGKLISTSNNVAVPSGTQSHVVQPAPSGDGIVFFDDFRSGDFSGPVIGEGSWGTGVSASVSSEQSLSAGNSLKIAYPVENANGYSFAEKRFHINSYHYDLWYQADYFIPLNYSHVDNPDWGDNNKGWVLIWGGEYEVEGQSSPLIAPNFWNRNGDSAMHMATTVPTYDSGNNYSSVNTVWFNSPEGVGTAEGVITDADRGKWVQITYHMTHESSPGSGDAVFEMWKQRDGSLYKLMDIVDGDWGGNAPGPSPSTGWNNGYILGWANAGFSEETVFFVDNVTLSTEPLI